MLRLQGLGSNTPSGVPYTDDEIKTIVRGGKQRGHIEGFCRVGRVLPGQGRSFHPRLHARTPSMSGSGGCGEDELGDDEDDDEEDEEEKDADS
ncbi:hypothetical protein Tco_0956608 [Tanacetum coccineum]